MKYFSMVIAAAAIVGSAHSLLAVPPEPEAVVEVTITCEGSQGICYTIFSDGVEYAVPGKLVKIVTDGTGRTLGCGSSELSATNAFLYSPGSTSSGVGYIGATGCFDPAHGTGTILTNSSTQTFTNYSDWQQAAH